jgi:hypothetical protein
MKRKILVLAALFMLAISTSAYAQSTSVAGKVSTLGFGVEGEMSLNDSFGIRVGGNYFTYTFTGTEGAINYDFDFNLRSVPILVDWHPLKGALRLTAGAIYNANNFEAGANYTGTIVIGGTTYTAAEVGVLKADIEFSSFAPYLGFGWDTTFGKDSGFGFSFEAGAMFQGDPEATITTSGAGAAGLPADLLVEEQDLQNSMDNFTIYPVIGAGINYRF